MNIVRFVGYCAILLIVTIGRPACAEVTEQQVKRAIDRGIGYLKSAQNGRGSWDENAMAPGGVACLCTLALLNCNVPLDDPVMVKALDHVRKLKVNKTYSVALQTMVLS